MNHVLDAVYLSGRLLGRYRPTCSCGWRGRSRLTSWAAAVAHAKHLLELTYGRLEVLCAKPDRYVVRWAYKYDEQLWVDTEARFTDPGDAGIFADLLENLPSGVRNIVVGRELIEERVGAA